jgi:hypothetical protein
MYQMIYLLPKSLIINSYHLINLKSNIYKFSKMHLDLWKQLQDMIVKY